MLIEPDTKAYRFIVMALKLMEAVLEWRSKSLFTSDDEQADCLNDIGFCRALRMSLEDRSSATGKTAR